MFVEKFNLWYFFVFFFNHVIGKQTLQCVCVLYVDNSAGIIILKYFCLTFQASKWQIYSCSIKFKNSNKELFMSLVKYYVLQKKLHDL